MTRDLLQDKIELDRERGARSFARFVRLAWPVIEPNPLVWGWHMDAVSEHLEAVTSGQIRDLVICEPPGTSKSLLVSTLWPAWDWIKRPTRRTIAATYGQDLSDKNAELQRNLITSPWFQSRWGHLVQIGKADASRVRFFRNSAGGWRFSSSVGGVMTGFHGDHLIFDDLVKAQDAEGRAAINADAFEAANRFWFRTMYTRRADAQKTARIGIAQRLHHEDTPARCIEAGYTALVLPMEYDPARPCRTSVYWTAPGATERTRFEDPRTEKGELLAPARFPREVVDADRAILGPLVHEAQNNQNPTPVTGAIFKDVLRNRWKVLPTTWARRIITVDCAFKSKDTSDFVAIQVWILAGPNYYLIDRICRRMGVTDTIAAVLETMDRYPQSAVYVEDKANGPAVIEVLKGEVSGIHEWSPGTDSKTGRAEAVAHLFASDNVFLPPDDLAPWIGEYASTLHKFPLDRHDDDVDATTMALLILYSPRARRWEKAVGLLRSGGQDLSQARYPGSVPPKS